MGYVIISEMGFAVVDDYDEENQDRSAATDDYSWDRKLIYNRNPWNIPGEIHDFWRTDRTKEYAVFRVIREEHIGAILAEKAITGNLILDIVDKHRYAIWS
jgi:hypothetical protein